jgi:hypothetical protein
MPYAAKTVKSNSMFAASPTMQQRGKSVSGTGTGLQQQMHNSPAAIQLRAYQQMADNSTQVKQLKGYKALANNSSGKTIQMLTMHAGKVGGGAGSGVKTGREVNEVIASRDLVQLRKALKQLNDSYDVRWLEKKRLWKSQGIKEDVGHAKWRASETGWAKRVQAAITRLTPAAPTATGPRKPMPTPEEQAAILARTQEALARLQEEQAAARAAEAAKPVPKGATAKKRAKAKAKALAQAQAQAQRVA